LRANVTADQFKIPCSTKTAKIRVIELINQSITAESILKVDANKGYLEADLDRDLLKVAMFDRHEQIGRIAKGFLKGFGANVGAVGTTIDLDENTLLVVGSTDRDMSLCANVLITAGGGMAVVESGELLEKIDFPFGGIYSLDPWKKVGRGLRRIQRCLRERGSPFARPMYVLGFLPFVTLPSLRITARGLVNAKERRLVPLFAES
jgi:adenine deaminase